MKDLKDFLKKFSVPELSSLHKVVPGDSGGEIGNILNSEWIRVVFEEEFLKLLVAHTFQG